MWIDKVIIPPIIEEKLERKHQVLLDEVHDALLNHTRIRFAEKGHRVDEDVYAAFGRTFAGRYLAVFLCTNQ